MRLRKYFFKIFIVLLLFSISYGITSIYVLYSQNHAILAPDLVHKAIEVVAPSNLSCYYAEKKGKHLISTVDEVWQFPNSIFFHKTSCEWSLQLREACSVESAARANKNRRVNVVFTQSLSETDCQAGVLGALAKNMSNIRYYRVDLNNYAEGTPLEDVFAPRQTWLGKWHYRKIGELLKFLTLYNFGGTVVDLDVMVVGSLDLLGDDWASRGGGGVESGIISVSRGLAGKYYAQTFLKALKHQIAYDGVSNADPALKDALNALCNTTDVLEMNRENCKGFRVYSNVFYNTDIGDIKATNIFGTYLGFHLWNETMGHHRTPMANDSLYATLARTHCPVVYHGFMSNARNNSQTIPSRVRISLGRQ